MREEVKMDAKRLITEVHKRPALWNQRHISYHNRDVTNRIWLEIATLFKLPKQVLKAKWKGLRDTFRAEIKKEQVYRKSKYTPNRPTWIHFKTLQFLKAQMLPRPPIWERSNNSLDNDASSVVASEDSCNGTDASEGISDVAALGDLKNRRAVPIIANVSPSAMLITTTSNKGQRRASNRISSSNTQLKLGTRRGSPAAQKSLLRAPCAVDAVNAVSAKDDLAPAIKSAQLRSDNLSRNSNNKFSSNVSDNNVMSKSCNNVSSKSSNNASSKSSNNASSNTSCNNLGVNGSNKNQIEDANPVKLEPDDHYDDHVEEFGNVTEELNNLVDDGSMLESMTTEEVLMAESAGESCVVAGQHAVDPLEGNRYDDNYYFFMSLLPHIRSLPAERRMLLRMQMQQLVYQEVYNKSDTTLGPLHQAHDQRP